MPLFEDFPDYGASQPQPTPSKPTVHREQLGVVSDPDRMFLEELALEHDGEFELVFRRIPAGSYTTLISKDTIWVGWLKHQLAERERRIHDLKGRLGQKYSPLPDHPAVTPNPDGFDVHRQELLEQDGVLRHIRLKSIRANDEPEAWR